MPSVDSKRPILSHDIRTMFSKKARVSGSKEQETAESLTQSSRGEADDFMEDPPSGETVGGTADAEEHAHKSLDGQLEGMTAPLGIATIHHMIMIRICV